MRFLALATDYDGTLAENSVVHPDTIDALVRFRASGRKLILVTGRILADLITVFPRLDLFDRVVAENGAVLYDPGPGVQRDLAEPPPRAFLDALDKRGVQPLAAGDVIVSSDRPHERLALEVIQDLHLNLQVILNKNSIMILPAGVDKVTGLSTALCELGLAPQDIAGAGDAENDYGFLKYCGYSIAVANALPTVKEIANLTTAASDGAGVVEWIGMVLRGEFDS
jgi:hydroxymethylpyrimidine pyrophosphatase-like HAD family hydrolase